MSNPGDASNSLLSQTAETDETKTKNAENSLLSQTAETGETKTKNAENSLLSQTAETGETKTKNAENSSFIRNIKKKHKKSIGWVKTTFNVLRHTIYIHILLAIQAINMFVYVLADGPDSCNYFLKPLVCISSIIYLIYVICIKGMYRRRNEESADKMEEEKNQEGEKEEKEKKEKEKEEEADNLCILLYIQIKVLAAGLILLQIIVPQISDEESSVYGIFSFTIEFMLIISVSHCALVNLFGKKEEKSK